MAKVSFMLALMAMAMLFGLQISKTEAQGCASQLTNLNVCAPYVVPGSNASPNSACCGALQSIDHDCLCNTLRIVSRLPSECSLPAIACGN